MSSLNILVALSNILSIYPIFISYQKYDYITFGVLMFVTIFSFSSHLFENHKHGMKGIKLINMSKTMSEYVSYILNRFDVLGCIFVAIRFFYLVIQIHEDKTIFECVRSIFLIEPIILSLMIIGFAMNVLSELDKTPRFKIFYVITHSLWHLIAFGTMGIILEVIYQINLK